MTVAVCLKCGAFKHGAWTPCVACKYVPDDDESLTRHLLVTDHYLKQEQLQDVAQRVKRGEPVDFPPEVLKAAWVSKAEMERGQRRMLWGCATFLAVAVAVAWWLALG